MTLQALVMSCNRQALTNQIKCKEDTLLLCKKRICHVCDMHFVYVVQATEGHRYSWCAIADGRYRSQRVHSTPGELVESVH